MKSFQGFACVFVCLVAVDHDCLDFSTVITTLSIVFVLAWSGEVWSDRRKTGHTGVFLFLHTLPFTLSPDSHWDTGRILWVGRVIRNPHNSKAVLFSFPQTVWEMPAAAVHRVHRVHSTVLLHPITLVLVVFVIVTVLLCLPADCCVFLSKLP